MPQPRLGTGATEAGTSITFFWNSESSQKARSTLGLCALLRGQDRLPGTDVIRLDTWFRFSASWRRGSHWIGKASKIRRFFPPPVPPWLAVQCWMPYVKPAALVSSLQREGGRYSRNHLRLSNGLTKIILCYGHSWPIRDGRARVRAFAQDLGVLRYLKREIGADDAPSRPKPRSWASGASDTAPGRQPDAI